MTAVLDYNIFASSPHHHPRIFAIQPDLHPMSLAIQHSKPVPGGPMYYRQPEVIQLVEVSPPPPLQHPSVMPSTSAASSSFCSESCDSSETDSDEDEICSSYCSSDADADMADSAHGYDDDTYGTRLSRVLAWRDGFARAMGAAVSSDALSSSYSSLLKRKIEPDVVDDDAFSLSSKRSRSGSQVEPSTNHWPRRRLSSHSCSACDGDFATRQSLREHGRGPCREACRIAVAYDLE